MWAKTDPRTMNAMRVIWSSHENINTAFTRLESSIFEPTYSFAAAIGRTNQPLLATGPMGAPNHHYAEVERTTYSCTYKALACTADLVLDTSSRLRARDPIRCRCSRVPW